MCEAAGAASVILEVRDSCLHEVDGDGSATRCWQVDQEDPDVREGDAVVVGLGWQRYGGVVVGARGPEEENKVGETSSM